MVSILYYMYVPNKKYYTSIFILLIYQCNDIYIIATIWGNLRLTPVVACQK